ncbi:C4-dicarboxylate TRAP transporter large permease protein DctM [subsurface metagenome]
MIESISAEILTLIMIVGVIVGIMIGYPLALALGAVGLIVGYAVLGAPVFELFYVRLFKMLYNYILLAVPLFIFMGTIMAKSGIADRMYSALYLWLGRFRGGLAVSTVLIGTVLAACVGIIGASITMLALIGLPSMIKRGYSKSLACGSVSAGGCLGILIPPSVLLVMYGPVAGLSVGKMFMAAFFPGFVLSGLYCVYIALRCLFQPQLAPVIPIEEMAVPLSKKTVMLATSMVPPGLLILAVLGSIFFGVAPPTEAAAIGGLAAIVLTVAYRRFSWQILREAVLTTLSITGMIFLIICFAYAFAGVFIAIGCGKVVEELILSAPFGRWGIFALVMFIIFLLGFIIDSIGIIFIMVPILVPVWPALGFDPLWAGMMVCINFQMSYMTPPMAGAIFYLRGSAPPELHVTTGDIILGVIPYVGLIMVGLGLCAAFPQIILWLPSMMIK